MNSDAFFYRLRAVPAHRTALIGQHSELSYRRLIDAVDRLADMLRRRSVRVLATQLDNGPEWAIAALAALRSGIVHVPLPLFFTAAQCSHVLDSAGVDALIARSAQVGFDAQVVAAGDTLLTLSQRAVCGVDLPPGTALITFTSGATAAPKGVCLSAAAVLDSAQSLAGVLRPLAIGRHLLTLPLSVLLENIAGLFAPLLAGAAVVAPGCADVGVTGSVQFMPEVLEDAVARHQAESVIVLPQMLSQWTAYRSAQSEPRQTPLKFVIVAGAALEAQQVARARASGLPAYESYGLSEASSVTTLSLPGADRPGSAGRALPHARLRLRADGEIEVSGALMLGYLGEPAFSDGWLRTGDLGSVDANGFVTVTGRRRNVLLAGSGRNVWSESVLSRLQAQPEIAHAVVFAEGARSPSAVVWPLHAGISDAALAAAVARVNEQLPQHAHVGSWLRAAQPYSAMSGPVTFHGQPRHPAIVSRQRADADKAASTEPRA